MPLGGEVQQPAGLGEQGDVGGVPGARAGADGGGEVLVGGVLDGDAGVLLEGLQGGVEAVGLDPAEVAQDGDDTVPGGASAGPAAVPVAAGVGGIGQTAGQTGGRGRCGAPHDGAAREMEAHVNSLTSTLTWDRAVIVRRGSIRRPPGGADSQERCHLVTHLTDSARSVRERPCPGRSRAGRGGRGMVTGGRDRSAQGPVAVTSCGWCSRAWPVPSWRWPYGPASWPAPWRASRRASRSPPTR